MKVFEKYFQVELFIRLYKVVLVLESVGEIRKSDQMKATERYFSAMLFVILY